MQWVLTTQVKRTEVTVHCELKILNLEEGEAKKFRHWEDFSAT